MKKIEIVKNLLQRLDRILIFLAIPAIFSLIFIYSIRSIWDLDIWLHLKTGEFIFNSKTIPVKDLFSFVLSGKSWVDHEWIFQLFSYFTFLRFGPDGLIYLRMLIITLSFFILFLAGRRLIGLSLETAVLLLIAVIASLSRFNIRPEIFSMLFFCIYLYSLEFYSNRKIIWLLFPLQILWVNLHGYFFLGPLVVAFFVLAELLRRKINFIPRLWKEEGAIDDSGYRHLKIILLVTVLASFINPRGIEGASYPLQVLAGIFSSKNEVFNYIQELKPVFSLKIDSLKSYYLLNLLCLAALIFNIKKIRIRDLLLGVFFIIFGIIARNVLFTVAVSFMVVAFYWGNFLRKLTSNISKQDDFKPIFYFLVRCVLAIFILRYVCTEINVRSKRLDYDFEGQEYISPFFGIEKNRFPQKAADFILTQNLPERMFNDFDSGSYLIGRNYPARKVFIDGRTELYGSEFFKQYKKIMKGDTAALDEAIKKYDLTAILLTEISKEHSSLIRYLYKSPEWVIVFLDEKGIIFLKNIPENRELIKKYKINFQEYPVQVIELEKLGLRRIYPDPYIDRAFLLDILEENDLVIRETKEALRILPSCWEAYYFSGKAYLRLGLYEQAQEALRKAALFSRNNKDILLELNKTEKQLRRENNKDSLK